MLLSSRVAMVGEGNPFVVRVRTSTEGDLADRGREAFLLSGESTYSSIPPGYRALLTTRPLDALGAADGRTLIRIPDALGYLADGDVIRVSPNGRDLRVLYRRSSRFNALLVTERCNSNCVMCSQPPRSTGDGHLLDELVQAIGLMSPETPEIGLTGGEPTLLHGGLLRILTAAKERLPSTALHMLSNGRLFSYLEYARRVAEVGHPDFMIGIPVYSDLPRVHDFVVQARGSFDQTLRGILNLARFGVSVEVRVVIHKYTYRRLPQLGAFLARNLPFVDHVALMGLELMGFTRMNLEALWIDPADYQKELALCVDALQHGSSRISIYNHQLCVLDRELWPFARQSISDWKNVYLGACESCGLRAECGGFFASGVLRPSAHIRPLDSPECAQLRG
jgi:His-Xaa-Ser system radical SAM maturase HxsC